MSVFFLGLVLTFALSANPVRAEDNPIRDWTAAALLIASLEAFTAVVKGNTSLLKVSGFILGLVFLFGSADERFEFHENIASTVLYFYDIRFGTVDGLDFNAVQDATTLSYAALGLAALIALTVFASLYGKGVFKGPHPDSKNSPDLFSRKTLMGFVGRVGKCLFGLSLFLIGVGLVFTPEFAIRYISLNQEIQPRVVPFIQNFRTGVLIVGFLLLGAGGIWLKRGEHLSRLLEDLLQPDTYQFETGIFQAVSFHLFAAAVLLFGCAMGLDTWDNSIASGIQTLWGPMEGVQSSTGTPGLGILFYDPKELANFVEELLEFASALCFMGMSGTLFSPGRWRRPIGGNISGLVWISRSGMLLFGVFCWSVFQGI